MRIYAVEYDLNIITVKFEKKIPEHRIETFTNPEDFITRVKKLSDATSVLHEAMCENVNTNIKTYAGELKEISLEKVIDPFSV